MPILLVLEVGGVRGDDRGEAGVLSPLAQLLELFNRLLDDILDLGFFQF